MKAMINALFHGAERQFLQKQRRKRERRNRDLKIQATTLAQAIHEHDELVKAYRSQS